MIRKAAQCHPRACSSRWSMSLSPCQVPTRLDIVPAYKRALAKRSVCLVGEFQPMLVVVSILIAVFASYTALDLAGSVSHARGRARAAWLTGGSVALGVGIWSMHFVGMLAFRMPGMTIAYDALLVAAS